MTILQLTKTFPIIGADFELQKCANEIISNLLIYISRGANPIETLQSYVWSQYSALNEYDDLWAKNQKHIIKSGRKSKNLMMQSFGSYRLAYYIKEKFNFDLHPKNFQFINYTYTKFYQLARMETAMLLSKYTDIKEFEIKIAILRLLFTYFSVYSLDAMTDAPFWTVSVEDINNVFDNILNSDVNSLNDCFSLLNVTKIIVPQQPKKKPVKALPQSADEILTVIDNSMSAAEKYAAIMEAWPEIKSERKAREILSQFGLSRKYTKTEKTEERNYYLEAVLTENKQLKEQVQELQRIVDDLRADKQKETNISSFFKKIDKMSL